MIRNVLFIVEGQTEGLANVFGKLKQQGGS
jgi:hypothetical protein